MFDALSWNEFLLIIVLILTGYYVFVSLLFYRREISLSVQNIKKASPLSTDKHVLEVKEENDLLGKAQPDVLPNSAHVTSTDSDQLQFSAPEQKEKQSENSHSDNQEALLIGTVADLLEEIKTLVQVIVDCEGDKDESISMFQSLFLKYPQLAETKFRTAINMFINFQKEQSRHSLNPFHSLLYTVPFFSDSRGRQRWHQRSHKLHAKLFPTGTTLMYAIGAVVGLVGAVKVYQKWNGRNRDTSKVAPPGLAKKLAR
jgi:hypothetical protein